MCEAAFTYLVTTRNCEVQMHSSGNKSVSCLSFSAKSFYSYFKKQKLQTLVMRRWRRAIMNPERSRRKFFLWKLYFIKTCLHLCLCTDQTKCLFVSFKSVSRCNERKPIILFPNMLNDPVMTSEMLHVKLYIRWIAGKQQLQQLWMLEHVCACVSACCIL